MKKGKKKYHLSAWFMLILVLVILPLNLLSMQSVINMNRELKQQVRLSVENVLDVYMNTLDMELTKADNYLYNFLTNNAMGICLQKKEDDLNYQNTKIWAAQDMSKNFPSIQEGCGYFIYVDKSDLIYSATADVLIPMKEFLQDKENIESIAGRWHVIEVDGKQYIIRKNNIQNVEYGGFFDFTSLKEQIESKIHYDNVEIEISDQAKNEINKNDVIISRSTSKIDWYIQVKIKDVSVMQSGYIWKQIQIILIILCCFCIPLIYIVSKKYILHPLNELNHAHYEFEIGNREYRIKEKVRFIETQNAFDSFNQMADNIKDLRLENVKKELHKKDLELKNKELELDNLQLQIRPHFLLNTFNLIYNLSVGGENDHVQDMVLYLSNYFRYIFRDNKKMELFGKELGMIEGYVNLVKIQYPDRIEVSYEIDPDVLMARVPPLLIHNFMENAVKHAMRKKSNLYIILSAEYMDGWITVEISDNGLGIAAEKVEAMNRGEFDNDQNTKERHIGISNSVKRLKYFYGEQAYIHIESEVNEGTTVTIKFPYNLEESADEIDVAE